jgi:hypothetical protein
MNTFNVGCIDDAAIFEKKMKIWPRRTMLLKNAALPPVLPLRSNLIPFPYINRIVCVSRTRNAQPKIGHPIQSHTTGTKTAWTTASEPYEDLFSRGMTQEAGEQRIHGNSPRRTAPR